MHLRGHARQRQAVERDEIALPARDTDGEQGVDAGRDAVVAHAAELQAGVEVGAGAARRRVELRLGREAAGAPATLDAAEMTMSMTADTCS